MKNLILLTALLTISFNCLADPCKGITKKGDPCSRKGDKSGYCYQHNPNGLKCGAKTKSGQPCKMVVKVSGSHCHLHSK